MVAVPDDPELPTLSIRHQLAGVRSASVHFEEATSAVDGRTW
jgi:hypothetical protein